MTEELLRKALSHIPEGRWAVGVSGGADSVALLLLLLQYRPDLSLHVAHLDHETRDGASHQDAGFVKQLSVRLDQPHTIGCRSQIESGLSNRPRNLSSRYREARMAFFRQVVANEKLDGILLAHHRDDQIESILLKVLSGVGPGGLTGMMPRSTVRGLCVVRPLLEIGSAALRDYLISRPQSWCEDASNQSERYARNRVRSWLRQHPGMDRAIAQLASSSAAVRQWLDRASPVLPSIFQAELLCDLPLPLSQHAAARWLAMQGVLPRRINAAATNRLVQMAWDAAAPTRHDFPDGVRVRRQRGQISAEPQGFRTGARYQRDR